MFPTENLERNAMPEWLIRDEKYIPDSDKDTFINKSILAMLNIISKIRSQNVYKREKFKVNVYFKVVFVLMLVILLSLSRSFTFVIIINIYLLLILSMMQAKEIVIILRLSAIMAGFTFIILLPSAFWGSGYSIVMITSKVFATITAVNILSHSTRWSSITSALKRFFVPDIFILVLDITIKYIDMLAEFSLNMLYALKLRSVGRNKRKYTSLSGIAGTLFIKSKEMSEDMYSAMECRGFTGEYLIYKRFKFSFADFVFILINMCILFIFVYLGRV